MANGMIYSSGWLQNFLQQRDQRQGQNMQNPPVRGTQAYQDYMNRMAQQEANVAYVNQMNQQNLAINQQYTTLERAAQSLYGEAARAGFTLPKPPYGGGIRGQAAMQEYIRDAYKQIESQYAAQQQAQQQAYEEAARRAEQEAYQQKWGTYEGYMKSMGYGSPDPLSKLYTGSAYGAGPSQTEYNYLRNLADMERYKQLMEQAEKPKMVFSSGQYVPQDPQSDYFKYEREMKAAEARAKQFGGMLKSRYDQQQQNRLSQRSPGFQQLLDYNRAQNTRQQQADLQSQAARGFYNMPGQGVQTPFAYQTWGGG